MKSNWKRLIALVCVLAMSLSLLAGCAKEAAPAAQAPAAQASAEAPAEGEKPLYTVQVMTNMAINPDIATSEENEIGRIIKEKFNIVFEFIPYAGDAVEKANLMLATGDYPDMVSLSSSELIGKYIEAGAAVNLEDYFDICPNFEKEFSAQLPLWRAYSTKNAVYHWENNTTSDGRLVGLGGDQSLAHVSIPQDVAIRGDLLVQQDYPNVIREEDFVQFLKKALAENPEIDGQPTVGLTVPMTEAWGLQGVVPIMYEKGENYPSVGNGAVVFNAETETFEDFFLNKYVYESFRFFNRLYREGLLDTESFTDTYQQTIDKMTSGRALSVWYSVWPMVDANAGFDAAGRSELSYVSIPFQSTTQYDGGEKRFINQALTAPAEACLITKNAEHPERIMELINWLLSEEGQILLQSGVEGKTYTIENGKRVPTEQYLADYFAPSTALKREVGLAYEYRFLPVTLGLASDGQPYDLYTAELTESTLSDAQRTANEKLGIIDFYDKLKIGSLTYATTVTIDPLSELGKLEPKLIDFRNKVAPQLIMAETEEEFQEAYDNAVADYQKLEPQQLIEEYNRLYAEKTK